MTGRCRVRLEPRQLPITDRLEQHADRPQRNSDDPDKAQPRRDGLHLPELKGHRHDPHQEALGEIHGPKRHDGKAIAKLFAHRPISVILALTVIAPKQVGTEPNAPHRRTPHQHVLAGDVAMCDEPCDPRDQHETEPPKNVDDACVFNTHTYYPERYDGDKDGDGGGEKHGGLHDVADYGFAPTGAEPR